MINHPHRSTRRSTPAAHTTKPRPAVRRPRVHIDHGFDEFADCIRRSFASIDPNEPIFTTDCGDLLEGTYLNHLPSQRQHHTCSECRRFLRTYGPLATINEHGNLEPVMWGFLAPPFYEKANARLRDVVRSATVTGVFLTSKTEWGAGRTGDWTHMAVEPPAERVYRGRALTAGQAMAAAAENARTVLHAMAEYTPKVLDEALRVLESGHLARSEKFVGPVRWLRALHEWPKGHGVQATRTRNNLLRRAVALAPEGYCHIRSSVVAPLLADIVAGVPFADLQRKHAAKVAPTQYQRPQAAPAAGNIAAAEKLVEKLGIARSLERRYARLSDLEAMWLAAAPTVADILGATTGRVFAHIKAKRAHDTAPPSVDLPMTVITWDKFSRTVLPRAERIEIQVPAFGSFIGLTAAVHADAPPILKWDREDRRNTVAWYVYPTGSVASQWGLVGGRWSSVSAVVPFPTLWGDQPMPFIANGAILVIDGAIDTAHHGNSLFPETLRADVFGARATIEAYSRSAKLSGAVAGEAACGYDLRSDHNMRCMLRVLAGGAWAAYQVDRWD